LVLDIKVQMFVISSSLWLFNCFIPDCNLSSMFSWQTKWKISGWCLFWQSVAIELSNSFLCLHVTC